MLTIVAHTFASPGEEEAVHAALHSLIAPTRRETGCIVYDLHRDNGDPAHFMFYETWQDRETWLAHTRSEHIAAARTAMEGKVARRELYELTKLG